MPKKIAPSFYFIGNHTVLDFINTNVAADGKTVDLLRSFDDILEWLHLSNFFTKEQIDVAKQKWGKVEADTVVVDTIKLRNCLHTLVQKGMYNAEVFEEDIECLNNILKEQVVTTTLARIDHNFVSKRQLVVRKPVDLLIPIAEAAIDLFTGHDLHLVKKCENPDCILHFYDNSKNNTRRWCSQRTCGNRMKVAAFLERRKNSDEMES